MNRDMYRFQKTRGLLPAEHLIAFATWLALRLGYRIDSSVFTHVRDVPGGGTLVQAKLRGPQGVRGELGDPGPKGGSYGGPRGEPGLPGLPGMKGPAGTVKGPPGTDGADGMDNFDNGVDGVDGIDGIPGEPGDPGDPGPSKGPPGNPGVDGNPGIDAEGPPNVGPPGPDGGFIAIPVGSDRAPFGEPGDPGEPADKFAIMESCGRCVGLFATECRDVLFEAVLRFTLPSKTRHHFRNLDPFYLDAIERDTLVINSVVCSEPLPVTTKLDGAALIVDLPAQHVAVMIVVTVQAIRKGFRAFRSKRFTQEQRANNNRFYAEAWNSEPRTANREQA